MPYHDEECPDPIEGHVSKNNRIDTPFLIRSDHPVSDYRPRAFSYRTGPWGPVRNLEQEVAGAGMVFVYARKQIRK